MLPVNITIVLCTIFHHCEILNTCGPLGFKEMGPKNVHMVCVQISDKGMTKKWGKSTKIWGTFKLQYLKLETSFWKTFKGYNQLLDMDI